MPDFCSAYGCSNTRSAKTRSQGITFHRFPHNPAMRSRWVKALHRLEFEPSKRSVICSNHFITKDFDRTGQTVRIRDGVVPSVFNFPDYFPKPTEENTIKSIKPPLNEMATEVIALNPVGVDHHYSSHESLLDELKIAELHIQQLESQLRNFKECYRCKHCKHINVKTKIRPQTRTESNLQNHTDHIKGFIHGSTS